MQVCSIGQPRPALSPQVRLDKGVRSKPLSPRERGWGEGGFDIGRMATHAAGGLEHSGGGRTVLPPPFPHPRPLSLWERGGTQSPCREGEKGGHSSVSTPMTPRPAPSMNDARVLFSMICGDRAGLASGAKPPRLEMTAIADSGSGGGQLGCDLGQGAVDMEWKEAAPAEILAVRNRDPYQLTGQRKAIIGVCRFVGAH